MPVSDKDCMKRQADLELKMDRSLGREIGQVRETAQDAQECAGKKVDKATFRWTLGVVIVAVVGALGICYWLGFNATNGVHEVKAEAKGTQTEVKQVKEHLHDFRTEQRTWNAKQELKLDEILEKISQPK